MSKPAPSPLSGRPGWRSWVPVARRDRPRWFSHRLCPPPPPPPGPPLKLLAGMGAAVELPVLITLNRLWCTWLLPSSPLPLVFKHQRDRAPVTIKGNSELGQLAQSRQHSPQGVCVGGGGGGRERETICMAPGVVSVLNNFEMHVAQQTSDLLTYTDDYGTNGLHPFHLCPLYVKDHKT